MLSVELHKHIDEIDAIEELIKGDIDDIIASIDKELLIKNPSAALGEAIDTLSKLMIERYIPLASEEGFNLSEVIGKLEKKDKSIVVDASKNPNENKELVNDNGINKE